MVTAIEAPVVSRKVNKLEKALQLIKDCGRDNAVVCLDPFQFGRVEDTPDMIKRRELRLYPYTQITDGYKDPAPRQPLRPRRGRRAAVRHPRPARAGGAAEPRMARPVRLELHGAEEWAKFALDGCKAYLEGYPAARAGSKK